MCHQPDLVATAKLKIRACFSFEKLTTASFWCTPFKARNHLLHWLRLCPRLNSWWSKDHSRAAHIDFFSFRFSDCSIWRLTPATIEDAMRQTTVKKIMECIETCERGVTDKIQPYADQGWDFYIIRVGLTFPFRFRWFGQSQKVTLIEPVPYGYFRLWFDCSPRIWTLPSVNHASSCLVKFYFGK